MINCPTCGKPMLYCSFTVQSLVGFYSPPGHDHDDNCLVRTYYCEDNHAYRVSKRRRCPVCDWVGKESCSCHPDKKVDEWPVAEMQTDRY